MTWFLILWTLAALWLAFDAGRTLLIVMRRRRTRRLLDRLCRPRYMP